jgi:hypothetical protein
MQQKLQSPKSDPSYLQSTTVHYVAKYIYLRQLLFKNILKSSLKTTFIVTKYLFLTNFYIHSGSKLVEPIEFKQFFNLFISFICLFFA